MKEELYIQIKRYYLREMSQEEQQAFEAKIASDSAFAQEVRTHARMYESIQQKGDQLLEAKLHSLGQQLLIAPSTAQLRPFSQRRNYLIAVAAAVVLLLSMLFVLAPQQDSQSLFAENFKPLSGARGDGAHLGPFFDAYEKEAYTEAISIFEQNMADSPAALEPIVNLYLGMSYLSLDQAENALHAFEKVSQESPAIYDDAQWNLALTLLKLDQPEEAKKILEKIAAEGQNEWQKKASKLLDEL